jgi:hypothetical protein
MTQSTDRPQISKEHQKLIDDIQFYKLSLVYASKDRTFFRISEIMTELEKIVPEHFTIWERTRLEEYSKT